MTLALAALLATPPMLWLAIAAAALAAFVALDRVRRNDEQRHLADRMRGR